MPHDTEQFGLNSEQRMVQDTVRRIAREKVAARAAESRAEGVGLVLSSASFQRM